MSKTLFQITALLFLLISCSKRTDGPVVIESYVNLRILDEQSNNLIDEGDFKVKDLKIYYLIDGQKELFLNSKLDYPKGFKIVEDKDKHSLLRIYLNNNIATPVTIVEYGENNADIIKAEFNRNGSSVILQKIWYNDKLKWENTVEYSSAAELTVVKTFN